jgi:hypothetical protein
MPELIAWLKANPQTPYATSGPGTTQHICGAMLRGRRGLKMTAVTYRASNLSIQDLIGGQIKLACDNFAVAYEQVKGGKLRAVSITSPGPYPLAKEIEPTATTFRAFELMPAFGWVGPANMPPEIVKKLIEELVAVGKIPEVRTALEKFGVLQTELPGPAYAEGARQGWRAGYAARDRPIVAGITNTHCSAGSTADLVAGERGATRAPRNYPHGETAGRAPIAHKCIIAAGCPILFAVSTLLYDEGVSDLPG